MGLLILIVALLGFSCLAGVVAGVVANRSTKQHEQARARLRRSLRYYSRDTA